MQTKAKSSIFLKSFTKTHYVVFQLKILSIYVFNRILNTLRKGFCAVPLKKKFYNVKCHFVNKGPLFIERFKNCPHHVASIRLHRLRFVVQLKQTLHSFHGDFIFLVGQRRKGIFQDITGVRQNDQRQHAFFNSMWVVRPP